MNYQQLISFGLIFLTSISTVLTENIKEDKHRPILKLSQGSIQGKISSSRKGKLYHAFLGLPYGKVPARFQVSETADGWEGVRQATTYGAQCAQLSPFKPGRVIGDEFNCLNLNVYTPKDFKNRTEENLAVLVFIHGGGFSSGSSDVYQAGYFMDHEIVLVTINYRLGALGFLNTKRPEASGNQGFKDMILALKWIKREIHNFGGDSNRIVIFGESAGSFAVSLLTFSPMAKGLFNGAIAQSGASSCGHLFKNEPSLGEARKLGYALDCPGSNPEYLVRCLQRIKVEDILRASSSKYVVPFDSDETPQFGVTFDTRGAEIFLPDRPSKLLSEGKFNKDVPFMTGVVTDESAYLFTGLILQNPYYIKKVNEEWGKVAPKILFYDKITKDPCKISTAVKNLYFGSKEIGIGTKAELSALFADRYFLHCATSTARLYSKHAPVYLYNFTYSGDHSFSQFFNLSTNNGEPKIPAHGDELQYMFQTPYFQTINTNSSHFEFSERLLKLWTSFAKQGKPSEIWGDNVKEWPTVNPSDEALPWLTIDKTISINPVDAKFNQRMQFWQNIDLQENYQPD